MRRETREYPDEPTGAFPSPPMTITDHEGRTIEIWAAGESDEGPFDGLVDMYDAFDPSDRAQGIPPTGRTRIRDWLGPLFENGVNVVATHDGPIGHATLVPDTDTPEEISDPGSVSWELAIFVDQSYQRAGIGTALLEGLLGHAREEGIERVWLTVERWNRSAIALYESVGFEPCSTESFEQEMSIRLAERSVSRTP